MSAVTIVINNRAYPCHKRSTATDPRDRHDEDLKLNGPATLEEIYQLERTRGMMTALPAVAAHFEVDRNELLAAWTRHYGVAHVFES